MNPIELKITVDASNVGIVNDFLSELSGVKSVKTIKVVDAEEAFSEPKTPPKARPSRAKAKPEPEPEPEEEDDFEDEPEDTDEEEDEITEDTLRELSAKKIGKHKDAIIAELAKYKVKGWANLSEKHYQAMHDFLTKLK